MPEAPDYPALLLLITSKVNVQTLNAENVNVILITANCTDHLQPMNFSVNKVAKEFLRNTIQL